MTDFLKAFTIAMFVIFGLSYSYQMFYTLIAILKRPPKLKSHTNHRFAFVIAARNEEKVIGNLIDSIRNQNYDSNLIDIFVVADNCTDKTAQIAVNKGSIVYHRNNLMEVGKGYALDFLFNMIIQNHDSYDAFFVFDADNTLDPEYTSKMNELYCNGYKIATCYRNSTNFSSNWISACYGLWFIRESRFLNYPRMILKNSCAVSGTGFMVADSIIQKNGGWKFTFLTEDIEFTVSSILNKENIGYAHDAIIYDEQPINFGQSWNQRMRWSKGFYQVFSNYAGSLIKSVIKFKDFSSYDMLMCLLPGVGLIVTNMFVNGFILILTLSDYSQYPNVVYMSALCLFWSIALFYISIWIMAVTTAIFERKRICCSTFKLSIYTLLFPIFIFTYVPIGIVAFFKKVTWIPISHGEPEESHQG